MRLKLPDFKDTHCVALTLCALSPDDDDTRARRRLTEPGRVLVAGYNSLAGRAHIKLHTLGGSKRPHFHLDVALGSLFFRAPKSTHRKEQVFRALGELSAFRWSVKPLAFFTAPREHASFFYDFLGRSVEASEGVEIEMTSVAFEFRGAPIQSLEVKSLSKSAAVDITGRREQVQISDSTLEEVFEFFDGTYKTFVRLPSKRSRRKGLKR